MSSTIFHISDTHLGYRNRSHPDGHGDTTGIEEANSVQAFDKIIWDAIKENVDAVIHTGDLFDHHVDQGTLDIVTATIGDLWAHNIPFYFILGDHDRPTVSKNSPLGVGTIQALEKLISSGKVVHANTKGNLISGTNVAVFGCDATGVGFEEIHNGYSLTEWSLDDLQLEPVATARFNILCLHEPANKIDINLEDVLIRAEKKGNHIDLVLLGHEHRPRFDSKWRKTLRNTEVVYAGPTIPISSYFEDSSPGYFRIRMKDGGVPTIDRREI